MISGQYYYFISGLPRISMEDSKLQLDVPGFIEQASTQLSPSDMQLLRLLGLEEGIAILSSLVYKEEPPAGTSGFYPEDYWQRFIEFVLLKLDTPTTATPKEFAQLPAFFIQHTMELFGMEERQPRLQFEHNLYADLYPYVEALKNGFLNAWFAYRRIARNTVLALVGRAHEKDFAPWLVGDDELTQLLATGRGADFGIGKSSSIFDEYLRAYEQNSVLQRERAYDILSWKWIDDHNFFQYFSIDRVLGYFAQLLILSRWINMDINQGKEVFFDTLQTLQNSFTFPAEFALKQKK